MQYFMEPVPVGACAQRWLDYLYICINCTFLMNAGIFKWHNRCCAGGSEAVCEHGALDIHAVKAVRVCEGVRLLISAVSPTRLCWHLRPLPRFIMRHSACTGCSYSTFRVLTRQTLDGCAAGIGHYFAFIFNGLAKAKDTGNDSSNPIIQDENTRVLCYIVTFTSIAEMNTVKVSVSNR